jgi:hypothetical protein
LSRLKRIYRIKDMNSLGPIFWQNTVPLIVTILVAAGGAIFAGWMSNASLNKRLDDIIARLGRIEEKLDNHQERIARLEERTSPISR